MKVMSEPALKKETIAPATGATRPPDLVVTKTVRRKNSKKRLIQAAAVLALVAIGLYFYLQPAAKSQPIIRSAALDIGDITKQVTATGTLQAIKTVQVGSQVSGTIRALAADFNSEVRKGQLLAQLDPTFYEASVSEIEANLQKAQAEYQNLEREAVRAEELNSRELVSKAEYEAARTKMLNARASVDVVRAQLQRARVNLSYTTIYSPISGTVVSRNVDVGQTVAASLNAPVLFVIAEDLRQMQVSASVDEADIGQIKTGQQVKFTVDAYPGEQFDGTVSQIRINPVTQQNVVTYSVMIDVANLDGKLLPGMTATSNVITATKASVLRIPAAALRFTPPEDLLTEKPAAKTGATEGAARRSRGDGGTGRPEGESRGGTVYVKSQVKGAGMTLKPVKVRTGLTYGTFAEVLSTDPVLKSGDSIVVGAFVQDDTKKAAQAGAPQPGTSSGAPRGGGGGRSRF